MQLEYSISRNDLKTITSSINRIVWSRRENIKKKYFLMFINMLLWIPVGVFLTFTFLSSDKLGYWPIYGVIIGASVILIYKAIEKSTLNKFRAEPGLFFGEFKLITSSEGITVEGENISTTTKWPGIKNLVRHGKYIFIFINNHVAHYIPVDSIGGDEDIQNFINYIQLQKENFCS
jgi:hypothetical protein